MARHSDGQNNYSIAGWIWALLAAVVLVVALIIGWNVVDSKNTSEVSQQQCAEGNLELAVWSTQEAAEDLTQLADTYNGHEPVVNDYCVTVAVTDTDDAAGIDSLGDKAPAAWAPADPRRVIDAAAKNDVHVTGTEAPLIGEAEAPLLRMATGNKVTEPQSRAADDFVQYVLTQPDTNTATVEDLRSAEPAPEDEGEQEDKDQDQALAPGTNVTFLLDTSDSMGVLDHGAARLDQIRGPLTAKFAEVGENGGAVGLWNYSSPLSPAARSPFRNNVDITVGDDGERATAIANQLGFGGAAHTHQSILAAYDSAVHGAEHARGDGPHRMILITDGPNEDDVPLDEVLDTLRDLHEVVPVQLDVIGIGAEVDQEALEAIAGATGGHLYPAADSAAFEAALNQAL